LFVFSGIGALIVIAMALTARYFWKYYKQYHHMPWHKPPPPPEDAIYTTDTSINQVENVAPTPATVSLAQFCPAYYAQLGYEDKQGEMSSSHDLAQIAKTGSWQMIRDKNN
jgi:NADH:ubiquinone oxidoreductase subunit F (NADH-binding)